MAKQQSRQKKADRIGLFILIGIGIILVIITIWQMAIRANASDPVAAEASGAAAQPTAAGAVSTVPSNPEDVERVTLQDAQAALATGEAVLLDVRSLDSYVESHAQGAVSIPLQDLEAKRTQLDPEAWIIPYCT